MSVTFHRDGPLGTVVLNRPGARNAVNPATARALYGAFVQFDRASSGGGRAVRSRRCLLRRR